MNKYTGNESILLEKSTYLILKAVKDRNLEHTLQEITGNKEITIHDKIYWLEQAILEVQSYAHICKVGQPISILDFERYKSMPYINMHNLSNEELILSYYTKIIESYRWRVQIDGVYKDIFGFLKEEYDEIEEALCIYTIHDLDDLDKEFSNVDIGFSCKLFIYNKCSSKILNYYILEVIGHNAFRLTEHILLNKNKVKYTASIDTVKKIIIDKYFS